MLFQNEVEGHLQTFQEMVLDAGPWARLLPLLPCCHSDGAHWVRQICYTSFLASGSFLLGGLEGERRQEVWCGANTPVGPVQCSCTAPAVFAPHQPPSAALSLFLPLSNSDPPVGKLALPHLLPLSPPPLSRCYYSLIAWQRTIEQAGSGTVTSPSHHHCGLSQRHVNRQVAVVKKRSRSRETLVN